MIMTSPSDFLCAGVMRRYRKLAGEVRAAVGRQITTPAAGLCRPRHQERKIIYTTDEIDKSAFGFFVVNAGPGTRHAIGRSGQGRASARRSEPLTRRGCATLWHGRKHGCITLSTTPNWRRDVI
jgi:hypothetical protein